MDGVSLAPLDGVTVPDGFIFAYKVVSRGGHLFHEWSLVDDRGGIHISANLSEFSGQREWSGGCETHYRTAPDYMKADKPSHDHCWLLGAPCWHDGSSLYFRENVAPFLPIPWEGNPHEMKHCHHDRAAFELRYLHRIRFEQEAE